MPTIRLTDRALLTVQGPDAEHFLQNIVTADLDRLEQGVAGPCALLTPQGKILFDFLISRMAGGFRLDCRTDIAGDLRKRLMLYRLRAKVEIGESEQPLVAARWDSDSSISSTESTALQVLRDGRFPEPANVSRIYGAAAATEDAEAYAQLRVRHGIAESGSDYALGDAFPHDVLLDQMGGVGFRKGCYIGQEVVSRMQHRGTARRRVLIVSSERPLPPAGTEVTA
ncbi:MAG: folate-binding protein YgfZ, partial [Rhizobiaceae bacterium]|nr:folate-binding protein YgfZ [Rhizobiaceae bacterium]